MILEKIRVVGVVLWQSFQCEVQIVTYVNKAPT